MKSKALGTFTIDVSVISSDPDVPLPAYQTQGSAGCDVCSSAALEILAGERMLVPTGLKMQIPVGFECQIRPRSSLALKHGVIVFNTPSTIDSDYRGELAVLLLNTGNVPFKVEKGDRIAQLVFAPVTVANFIVVDRLNETSRGEGGWGSTGVR